MIIYSFPKGEKGPSEPIYIPRRALAKETSDSADATRSCTGLAKAPRSGGYRRRIRLFGGKKA